MAYEIELTLIQHLSKEIETHTNSLTDFRAKTSFTLLVGPFILLGSFLVLVKTINVRLPIIGNFTNIGLLIGLGICFMGIGFACSQIEKHVWAQNNVWRGEIKRVSGSLSADEISSPHRPNDQPSNSAKKEPPKPYEYNANLAKAYFWFYFLVLLTFACGGFLFSRLEIPTAATAGTKVVESARLSGITTQEQTSTPDPRKP